MGGKSTEHRTRTNCLKGLGLSVEQSNMPTRDIIWQKQVQYSVYKTVINYFLSVTTKKQKALQTFKWRSDKASSSPKQSF